MLAVAYIYFDYEDGVSQNINYIIRSLLKQLLNRSSPAYHQLKSMYIENEKVGTDPDPSSFVDLLRYTVASNIGSVFVVFDALDECGNEKFRESIITLICQLKEAGAKGFCTTHRSGNTTWYIICIADRGSERGYTELLFQCPALQWV